MEHCIIRMNNITKEYGKNEKRAKRFLSLGGKNEHNSKCK